MGKKIIIGIFIVIIVIIAILSIAGYNKLINLDETIANRYHEIENRLQERSDKISQIVSSVSGLEEHEKAIYDRIMNARMAYQGASSMDELIEADAEQAQAFSAFLVVVEDNPAITATSGFLTLIDEISRMESQLSFARRDYNNSVLKYNNQVRRFPSLIYQKLFNFPSSYSYWKMKDGADEVPTIDFN